MIVALASRLDWLWFCEYDFDTGFPRLSVLSKARRRWGPEVFRELFQRILTQCVEADLVDGEFMHMDSSFILADTLIETLQPAFAVFAAEGYQ